MTETTLDTCECPEHEVARAYGDGPDPEDIEAVHEWPSVIRDLGEVMDRHHAHAMRVLKGGSA